MKFQKEEKKHAEEKTKRGICNRPILALRATGILAAASLLFWSFSRICMNFTERERDREEKQSARLVTFSLDSQLLSSFLFSLSSFFFLINNPLRVLFAPAGCWAPCFHPHIEKKKNAVSWLYIHTERIVRASAVWIITFPFIGPKQGHPDPAWSYSDANSWPPEKKKKKKKKKKRDRRGLIKGAPHKNRPKNWSTFPSQEKKGRRRHSWMMVDTCVRCTPPAPSLAHNADWGGCFSSLLLFFFYSSLCLCLGRRGFLRVVVCDPILIPFSCDVRLTRR